MTRPGRYGVERLGELLSMLPPAPSGWVQAAQELPAIRPVLDEIVARAESDAAFREALVADLELALGQADYEPLPSLVGSLRRLLPS